MIATKPFKMLIGRRILWKFCEIVHHSNGVGRWQFVRCSCGDQTSFPFSFPRLCWMKYRIGYLHTTPQSCQVMPIIIGNVNYTFLVLPPLCISVVFPLHNTLTLNHSHNASSTFKVWLSILPILEGCLSCSDMNPDVITHGTTLAKWSKKSHWQGLDQVWVTKCTFSHPPTSRSTIFILCGIYLMWQQRKKCGQCRLMHLGS